MVTHREELKLVQEVMIVQLRMSNHGREVLLAMLRLGLVVRSVAVTSKMALREVPLHGPVRVTISLNHLLLPGNSQLLLHILHLDTLGILLLVILVAILPSKPWELLLDLQHRQG